MNSLKQVLSEDYRELTAQDMPNGIILHESTEIFIMFEPQECRIEINTENEIFKFGIYQERHYSPRGLLAFLIALENGLVSFRELKYFTTNCSCQYIFKLLSQLMPRFTMFYTTPEIEEICGQLRDYGGNCLQCLLTLRDSTVSKILIGKDVGLITDQNFTRFIQYYLFEDEDLLEVVIEEAIKKVNLASTSLLHLLVINECQVDERLTQIIDQEIVLINPQKIEKLLFSFIKINSSQISLAFLKAVLNFILMSKEPYILINKLLQIEFECKAVIIREFLSKVQEECADNEQKSILFKEFLQHFSAKEYKDVVYTVQEYCEWTQFATQLLANEPISTELMERFKFSRDFFYILLLKHYSEQPGFFEMLKSMRQEFTFYSGDSNCILWLKNTFNEPEEGAVISFPKLYKSDLQILLSLHFDDIEATGYEKTVCEAAKDLLAAISSRNFSADLFNTQISELYLTQIVYVVSLSLDNYNNVRECARAFKFTEQTQKLLSELENQLVIVLIQLEELHNYVCSYKYGDKNFKFLFSYRHQQSQLNAVNINIIYNCFISCCKSAVAQYLFLEALDESIYKRYFSQMFENCVLCAMISGDCSMVKELIKDNSEGYDLIAAFAFEDGQFANQESVELYQLFSSKSFKIGDCVREKEMIATLNSTTRLAMLNQKYFIAVMIVEWKEQRNFFYIQELLFHSSNYYIDNLIDREYVIMILNLFLSVQQQFEHINGLSQEIAKLIDIILLAAQNRNCFIQFSDLEEYIHNDNNLFKNEFVQFLTEYLLQSNEFPTYNLTSLAEISNYIFSIDVVERNRICAPEQQGYLKKYKNARIDYNKNVKHQTEVSNYFYVLLLEVLETFKASTFCTSIYEIFLKIMPHFEIDCKLSQVVLIFILSKLYLDPQAKKSVIDLIYEQIVQSLDESDENAQNLFIIIQDTNILPFDVFSQNSLLRSQQVVKFGNNEDDYVHIDYSAMIELVKFLFKAKQKKLAYFYIIYLLRHEQVENYLIGVNAQLHRAAIKNILQFQIDGQCWQNALIYETGENQSNQLEEYLDLLNDMYKEKPFSHTMFSGEISFLIHDYQFHRLPLSILEKPITRQMIINSLMSQKIYESQETTEASGYFALFVKQIDEDTSFSQEITKQELNFVYNNIMGVILKEETHELILSKIVQIFFKLSENLKAAELEVLLILQIHSILLTIFHQSQDLMNNYYKIYFVVWLEGCYFIKEQEQLEEDISLLKSYLTGDLHSPETGKTPMSQNFNLAQENIHEFLLMLKLPPFYIINELVYIFDGFNALTEYESKASFEYLFEFLAISVQHYAHFDLIMRKLGIFYENNALQYDFKDQLKSTLIKCYESLQANQKTSRYFAQYVSYSNNYTLMFHKINNHINTSRVETIQSVFCYPSYQFLIDSETCKTDEEYEQLLQNNRVYNFKFIKIFESKAKPKLFEVKTTTGLKQLMIKGIDDTLVDNCIMDYLSQLNLSLGFTEYRFKTYYIGQIYKLKGESGYNIIEILENIETLNDFVNSFPKSVPPQKYGSSYEDIYESQNAIYNHNLTKFIVYGRDFNIQNYQSHIKIIDSIACWHVIQYALSILDRHTENILIDLNDKTIHNIDFEASFFYGKELPTPDIIDLRFSPIIAFLLGPAGIHARYRQTAENMLALLKQQEFLFLNCFLSFGELRKKQSYVMRLYKRLNHDFSEYWQCVQKSQDKRNMMCMFSGWKPFDQHSLRK